MKRVHELKTLPEFWHRVRSGEKTAEVRKDDRDFQKGDLLTLVLHDPGAAWVPNETMTFEITHVLRGGQWGIEPGYVVLSLGSMSPDPGAASGDYEPKAEVEEPPLVKRFAPAAGNAPAVFLWSQAGVKLIRMEWAGGLEQPVIFVYGLKRWVSVRKAPELWRDTPPCAFRDALAEALIEALYMVLTTSFLSSDLTKCIDRSIAVRGLDVPPLDGEAEDGGTNV